MRHKPTALLPRRALVSGETQSSETPVRDLQLATDVLSSPRRLFALYLGEDRVGTDYVVFA